MILAILLVIGGLVLLILGGEGTVRGGSAIATRLKIQPFVIGATVIAFGTSAPELAVTIIANIKEAPGLALGNIVGSNIANLGLILGVAALVAPLFLKKKIFKNELPTAILVLVLLMLFAWNGTISRIEGIILLASMVLATLRTIRRANKDRLSNIEAEETPAYSTPVASILVVVGLICLFLGGKFLVDGAVVIAEAMGVPQWVIGVVIVALGTSMPEVAASVTAALHGKGDIAIGNVLGSNVFNVLLVLGTGATIRPISVEIGIHFDLLVYASLTIFVLVLVGLKEKITRIAGILLLLVYIVYVTLSLV